MSAAADNDLPSSPQTATAGTHSNGRVAAARELLTLLGAVGAGVALVAYVLLSYVCSWYYAQFGVTPADVELNQATLLLRTAVGLAWMVPFAVLFVAFSMAPGLLVRWLLGRWKWIAAVAAVALAALTVVYATTVFSPPFDWILLGVAIAGAVADVARPRRLIAIGGVIAVALTVYFVVDQAHSDADLMADGLRPGSIVLGSRPPWDATVVRAHWVDSEAHERPVLPTCLFYLGESGGTSVFVDHEHSTQRSLRLPTSMLAIEVLPDAIDVAGDGC